ncbi:MAG: DUF6678 family protein [Brevundimonas sp.]|uniref:DUF6678 family protein n=1 Tax=Brevundimonas sp. TaxID=1871086 RepID=UPI003003083E
MARTPDRAELARRAAEAREVHRQRVREAVQRRGLASVMNQTRWEALIAAIHRLPFAPAYYVQEVLGSRESLAWEFKSTSTGCWCAECLGPFHAIEWMWIIPRLWRRDGALLAPVLVDDCSIALRSELDGIPVPYFEDGRGFWIQGYSAGDPTLGPPEQAA